MLFSMRLIHVVPSFDTTQLVAHASVSYWEAVSVHAFIRYLPNCESVHI